MGAYGRGYGSDRQDHRALIGATRRDVGGASPGHISCTSSSFFGVRRIGVVVAAVLVTGRRAAFVDFRTTRGAGAIAGLVLIGAGRARWIGGTMVSARLADAFGGPGRTGVPAAAEAAGVAVVGARSDADMPGASIGAAAGAGIAVRASELLAGGGGVDSDSSLGDAGSLGTEGAWAIAGRRDVEDASSLKFGVRYRRGFDGSAAGSASVFCAGLYRTGPGTDVMAAPGVTASVMKCDGLP